MEQTIQFTDFQVSPAQTLSQIASTHNGVIICFVPVLGTPSSIMQLKNLRDGYYSFKELGWELLGITTSGTTEIEDFRNMHNIKYQIISDDDYHISETMGVLGIAEKSKRQTYILAPDLSIIDIIREVEPGYHKEQILDRINKPDDPAIFSTTPITEDGESNLGK